MFFPYGLDEQSVTPADLITSAGVFIRIHKIFKMSSQTQCFRIHHHIISSLANTHPYKRTGATWFVHCCEIVI